MKMWFGILLGVLLAAGAHANRSEKLEGPAPDFQLKTLSGETVRLADLKGQVVMVNFWASWCAPCRQEMPLLNKIHEDYSKAGFTLLGINLDSKTKDASGFLASVPVSFPVLLDPQGRVADQFNNQAMPSSYFIDKRGNLAHVHRGYRPGEEEDYRKTILKLLAQ